MVIPPPSPIFGRPEVHGHRGCRGLFPENTLPAFLHAFSLGVDVLELDVVVSADRQVVVSHEPWLSARLGTGPGGEEISPTHEHAYNLYQLPYAAIRRCMVGIKPHPDFPAQQRSSSYRPLLREVLSTIEAASHQLGRPPMRYAIELKSSPDGDDIFHPQPVPFVELVLAELHMAAVQPRTTLLSFDARILQVARQLAPNLALCLLTEVPIPVATLFDELGFVPETLGPDFQLLSYEMVQELAVTYPGLRLVPWTLNDPQELRQALAWKVTGITTDYPDRLLALQGRG